MGERHTDDTVEISVEHPATPAAQECLAAYFAELDQRFDTGFDPALTRSADIDELTQPAGVLLVARLGDEPVGCGAVKFHEDEPAEIKRMWVRGTARGLGLGRRMLAALEDQAKQRGAEAVRLETNQTLDEAISLYRSAGYREVPAFNDETFAHHWFEKPLTTPSDSPPGGGPSGYVRLWRARDHQERRRDPP